MSHINLNGLNDPEYLAAFLVVNPELANLIQNPEGSGDIEQTAQETHSLFEQFTGTRQNFLIYNPASSKWTWEEIKKDPVSLPILYIFGMLGYAFSLIVRIIIFVVTFFKIFTVFFETLFAGKFAILGHRMKFRSLVFLGATGELVSGAIGVVCPPLAYKFDEWIQSNPLIHAWYRKSLMSFWRYELEGREVDAQQGETGLGGGAGNEHRLILKKERVKDQIKYFNSAKTDMEKYIKPDDISGSGPMQSIFVLGMLHALAEGKSLRIFRDEAVEKYEGQETDPQKVTQKKKLLDEKLAQFEKYWKALAKTETTPEQKLTHVPLIGRFFRKESKSRVSNGYLGPKEIIQAVKYELLLNEIGADELINEKGLLEEELKSFGERSLIVEGKEITLKKAIEEISSAVKDFAQEIAMTDREMFIAVTKEIFTE